MADSSPYTRKPRLSSKSFVDEFLTCRLCEELYNATDRIAKVLPCIHTLCKECLEKLTQDEHVRCPFCKQKWAFPEGGFPNHYILGDLQDYRHLIKDPSSGEELENLQEDIMKCFCCPVSAEAGIAVGYCKECEGHVCQTCIDNHKLMRQMINHTILELTELVRGRLGKSRCHLHTDQDLTVYCTTCQRAVCHTCCALTTHDGHERIDLRIALANAKRELRVLAERGREQQEPLLDLLTSIDSIINELNGLCSTREDEIQSLFDEIEKAVRVQCESAKTFVRDLCQTKTRRLKKQKSMVDLRRTEYESACEFAEQACKVVNPIQLLSAQTQISNRLKDLTNGDNNNLPDYWEPLDNTYMPFQKDHNHALREFRQYISQLGVLQSTATIPSHCRITRVPSGDVTPGETETVLLKAGAIDHEASQSGGDPFQAHLISPNGSRQDCKILDHQDGSYDVAYTPANFGSHSLDIRLFGRPIRGSPFEIKVDNPVPSEVSPKQITWLPAVAGFPHTITVYPSGDADEDDTELAKARNLQVQIQNSSGHDLPFTVTKRERQDSDNLYPYPLRREQGHFDDVHLIKYTPPHAEQLKLVVKHNGQRLSESPSIIDVAEVSKEETVIVLGNPVVNQRWMISVLPKNNLGRFVPISHAVLKLKVTTLKQQKELKIEAHHVTSDHVHIFHCIPHRVGIYQVDVMIHGESIHGRALPVNVESWRVFPTTPDKENFPTSVATSDSGFIFLSDTKVGSIHVHNTDGSYSNLAVNMRKSSSIAIDYQGRLILLVPERKRVHVYEQGRAIMDWKCTRDNAKPITIACSRHSSNEEVVIIADASPDFNGLFLYKTDGTPHKCISLSSNFIVEGQDSICVDDRQHIFICHSTKAKVIEFDFDGLFIREFPTDIKGHQLAIASSSDGFILVSEKGRIVVLDRRTGFAKFKGDIQARGDSYGSMATTNDGCVVALDVAQRRLVKYGYLIQ